jgi:hypothetical protein
MNDEMSGEVRDDIEGYIDVGGKPERDVGDANVVLSSLPPVLPGLMCPPIEGSSGERAVNATGICPSGLELYPG